MSPQKHVVVVLGASALQRPLIRAAREAGCRVVSVDNIPHNVGHRDADASYNVSTRDISGVIKVARAERARAVLTACSDVALPAAAAANAALDLGGFGEGLLGDWFPKNRLRQFQRNHQLNHPVFVSGSPGPGLVAAARALSGPVVVKPSDRSGSRGVTCHCDVTDPAVEGAIDAAAAESFAGRVVVEQFIVGSEYGGDAWVREGTIDAAFVTRKHMHGTIVRGHRYPSLLSREQEKLLIDQLQAHVSAADYRSGPLNFDVRMTEAGLPYVLEIAPRLGGNWIPQLVEFATGIDLFDAVIRGAIGQSVHIDASPTGQGASHVIGASAPVTLKAEIPVAEIQSSIPALVELEIDVGIGDRVDPMRDSGQQVGRALFDVQKLDYAEAVVALNEALAPWIAMSAVEDFEAAGA